MLWNPIQSDLKAAFSRINGIFGFKPDSQFVERNRDITNCALNTEDLIKVKR
jgi:hypothetical protein